MTAETEDDCWDLCGKIHGSGTWRDKICISHDDDDDDDDDDEEEEEDGPVRGCDP